MQIGDNVSNGFVYWVDPADSNHVKIAHYMHTGIIQSTLGLHNTTPTISGSTTLALNGNTQTNIWGCADILDAPNTTNINTGQTYSVESHLDGVENTLGMIHHWINGYGQTGPFNNHTDPNCSFYGIVRKFLLQIPAFYNDIYTHPTVYSGQPKGYQVGLQSYWTAGVGNYHWYIPAIDELVEVVSNLGQVSANNYGHNAIEYVYPSSTQVSLDEAINGCFDLDNNNLSDYKYGIAPTQEKNVWGVRTYGNPVTGLNPFHQTAILPKEIWTQFIAVREYQIIPDTYNCTNGVCSLNTQGTGTYPSLASCQAACIPISCITFPVCDTAAVTNVSVTGANDGEVTLPFHYEDGSGPIASPISVSFPLTYELFVDVSGTWNTIGGPQLLTSSSQTSFSYVSLSPGSYKHVITDNETCTCDHYFTITEPNDPCSGVNITEILAIINKPGCTGNFNGGLVNVNLLGGTAPYNITVNTVPACFNPYALSYSNNGVFSINNICIGTYVYNVVDDIGCQTQFSFNVTCESCDIHLSGSIINPRCFGDDNPVGGYDANVWTPNSSTFSYELTGNLGSTLTTIGGQLSAYTFGALVPDSYTLIATDDTTLCTSTITFTIATPPPMIVSGIVSNVSMFGLSDGSISITISGGMSPYNYIWSNGATTQNITNLIAGTYTVFVTDMSGCVVEQTFTIKEPECNLFIAGSVTGSSSGTVDTTTTATATIDVDSSTVANYDGKRFLIDIPDGSGSFGYYEVWFDATGSTTAPTAVTGYTQIEIDISSATTVSGIATQIKDALNLNTSNLTATVSSDIVSITFDNTGTAALDHASTNGTTSSELNISLTQQTGNDGSINLYTPLGGSPPYTYSWVGPNGYISTSQDISSLSVGLYTVTVCDSLGCCEDATFLLMPGDCITSDEADDAVDYLNSLLDRCGCDLDPCKDASVLLTSQQSRSSTQIYDTYVSIGNISYTASKANNFSNSEFKRVPKISKELEAIIKSPSFKKEHVNQVQLLEKAAILADQNEVEGFVEYVKYTVDTGLTNTYNVLIVANERFKNPLLEIEANQVTQLNEKEILHLTERVLEQDKDSKVINIPITTDEDVIYPESSDSADSDCADCGGDDGSDDGGGSE